MDETVEVLNMLNSVDTVDPLEYTNETPGVYGTWLASMSYLDSRL